MRVDGRMSDQHEMPEGPGSGPMQPLTATFTTGRVGSAGVIVATGELDLQTDGAFGAALDTARASGGDLLVVDLSAVTFMGSAGIAQLVRLYREEVRTVVVTMATGGAGSASGAGSGSAATGAQATAATAPRSVMNP